MKLVALLLLASSCFLLAQGRPGLPTGKVHTLPDAEEAKTISLNPNYYVFGEALSKTEEKKKLPLLIMLHGAGAEGLEIEKIRGQAPRLMRTLAKTEIETLIVTPQAAKSPRQHGTKGGWVPADLNVLLAHLLKTLPVDPDRVYLTGSSMGGYGTYAWAGVNPEHFAAIAPMVGGLGALGPKDVTPQLELWGKNLATLPMRAYYGGDDRVVPADRGEMILKAIKKTGGRKATVIVLDGVGHNAGQRAYSDPDFFRWLFKQRRSKPSQATLPRVRVSADDSHFVLAGSGKKFTPWGFNYLGEHGRLAEDDWHTPEGWARVEKDFREMKKLGANIVRWHLQFETFMTGAESPDEAQLARLGKLLNLARETGLYLDLTGLNCFRKGRIPPWYDDLPEAERWRAQERFWSAIAKTCAGESAVFCYDLINEPVIGKPKDGEHPWVGGELGGFHFVQRISHNADGRDSHEVAADWVKMLVGAIREHDEETPVTVGVIPWAFVWPNAKPLFYSPKAADHLDFVSIHCYPEAGKLDKEMVALAVYDIGKPLLIEEFFPMKCSVGELENFMDAAAPRVDGWISHYFGHTPDEHRAGAEPAGELCAKFFDYWSGRK
ncbi:MAG: pimeloyl-ACP methyl ester carboxylesterase [Verrucomicrobiales bacterium]|jgi:pimeloyl-ACP methyl ester carboxylesterase